MKRLLTVFLCVFLVSCSVENENKDYFLTPRTLHVTFEDQGVSILGRLETSTKGLTFYPDNAQGLCICLTNDGGHVSYNGIEFGGSVAEASRLMPLYQALTKGSLVLTKDGVAKGNGFKLTVHKEINNEE